MTEVTLKGDSTELVNRLVDWNVDVLQRLLTQIVAAREAAGKGGWDEDPVLETKETILDEVVEAIDLPGFDSKAYVVKPVELDPQVASQLREFVNAIALAYHRNPFHCLQHASHVSMAVTKLISRIVVTDFNDQEKNEDGQAATEVSDTIASHLHNHTYGITSDPLTQFAVVLSALIHAVDHRGLSNDDLIKEEPETINAYKGRSVTEQRSVEKAWTKLMEPDFENLRRCIYADKAEKQRFRQVIVNAVLATDIEDEELQNARMQRWERHFGPTPSVPSNEEMNLKATIVIECLMQSSDIFHTMQHWHVYLKWNERVFLEANAAFVAGRSTTNPAETWYRSELNFFDDYVIPLAMQLKDLDAFVVCSDEYLNYALKNRQRWANGGKRVVAEYVKKYNCSTSGSTADDDKNLADAEKAIPKHVQRLVDWNVEALERSIKHILAKRAAGGSTTKVDDVPTLQENGKAVVEEVTETISFPAFDPATSADKLDPSAVDMSPEAAAQLRQYVSDVASKFRDNRFHCLDHSSYVSMTAQRLLQRLIAPRSLESATDPAAELHKKTFGLSSDPIAQFAVVFAALIHDIDHSGIPNMQIVKEEPERAAKYKNRSIAEQHSIDLAWNHLMSPGFEALRACIYSDETELKRFRQIVVNAVLATDSLDEGLETIRKTRKEKSAQDGLGESEEMNLKACMVIVIVLRISDSFHAIQHWQVFNKWNERNFHESYAAFISERLKDDPTKLWYQAVLDWFDQQIIPLCEEMKAIGVFGPSADECLKFAQSNRKEWASKGQELISLMVRRFLGKKEDKERAEKIAQRQSLS